MLLVTALPLSFALFTNHAWEDYYITLRSSRNLVLGHGLVFNSGEPVHTFTSPLGVLVPAFFTWVTGVDHEMQALWFFRFFNAFLLFGSALIVWRRFETLKISLFARCFFYGVAFTESKLIDFSTNGMETAILIFFTLLLWSELERSPGPRIGMIAVGCAGLLWTRPDSFILSGALILPHLIIRTRSGGHRLVHWRPIIIGILIGGVCYVPWFTWAWWYYGSPIPHTIIAKSQVTSTMAPLTVLSIPWLTLSGKSLFMDIFLPAYWFYGNWPKVLSYVAYTLSTIAGFAWIIPRLPATARRTSLTLFFGMFYICAIIFFPWYSPPWTLLATLALTFALDHALKNSRVIQLPILSSILRISASAVVFIQILVLAAVSWEMRVQQRVIEQNIRRDIGLWLRSNSTKNETVFMECLGYIGYYSQLKTYDYPGLSSPEVVSTIKSGSRRFTEVITRLNPTWLVLRPFEIADASKPENAALHNYTLVRVWDGQSELDSISFLPGRGWLERDAKFFVLRRKSPSD